MNQWLRSIDIMFSSCAIVLLAPFWLLISIFILIEDPGPIFFRQQRVGLNEKNFMLYKFRSMRVNNIPPLELGAIKHNHSLVTKVGYVIRRFKLDETLQFLSVFLGKMSLVGPRPCLPERLSSMSRIQKKRFSTLPGLTGWAEVNGNVELTFEEQVLLDIWYVEHKSLALDFKILLKTIGVVLLGSKKNEKALMEARGYYETCISHSTSP